MLFRHETGFSSSHGKLHKRKSRGGVEPLSRAWLMLSVTKSLPLRKITKKYGSGVEKRDVDFILFKSGRLPFSQQDLLLHRICLFNNIFFIVITGNNLNHGMPSICAAHTPH